MEKRCFKCNQIKSLCKFYKHKGMKDGYLGKCKDCTKKYALEHRGKNIERIRAYDRQRGKLPHRILATKLRTKWFRKHNPVKYAAHTLIGNAIRDGRIKKPKKCSMCGKEKKIYGHHTDYYKPLDVIWACQACHIKLHKGE